MVALGDIWNRQRCACLKIASTRIELGELLGGCGLVPKIEVLGHDDIGPRFRRQEKGRRQQRTDRKLARAAKFLRGNAHADRFGFPGLPLGEGGRSQLLEAAQYRPAPGETRK